MGGGVVGWVRASPQSIEAWIALVDWKSLPAPGLVRGRTWVDGDIWGPGRLLHRGRPLWHHRGLVKKSHAPTFMKAFILVY